MEGRGFRDRIQEFTSRNAVVAGVSFDSPAKNRAFREKNAFPFDLLCDEDRSVSMSYGAAKKPRQWFARRISYLIDPEGRIARVYEKVKAGKHPDEVLATLDELGGPDADACGSGGDGSARRMKGDRGNARTRWAHG